MNARRSHRLTTVYRGRSTGVRAACVSLTFVIAAAGALLIFGRVPSWAGRNTSAAPKLELNHAWTGKLDTGEWHAPALDPSRLYSLSASIDAASLRADSRYWIGLEGPGGLLLGKTESALLKVHHPRPNQTAMHYMANIGDRCV